MMGMDNTMGQYICKSCGSPNFTAMQNGKHVSMYCVDCGIWQTHISQYADDGKPATPAQDSFAKSLIRKKLIDLRPLTQSQAGEIIRMFKIK
jgi:uncharacterized Zn finger protein (UPF0148 family)